MNSSTKEVNIMIQNLRDQMIMLDMIEAIINSMSNQVNGVNVIHEVIESQPTEGDDIND